MEAPVINIALYGLPKRNFFLESHFPAILISMTYEGTF